VAELADHRHPLFNLNGSLLGGSFGDCHNSFQRRLDMTLHSIPIADELGHFLHLWVFRRLKLTALIYRVPENAGGYPLLVDALYLARRSRT
jgi:hypothetical protein